MPSVGSGTYAPGPNMVCSPQQEKVGTGSIEASTCPVYSDLRIRATLSICDPVCCAYIGFLFRCSLEPKTMPPLPKYLTQDEPQRFCKVLTSHRNCSPQFGGSFFA